MEVVASNPSVLFDVAHNEEKAAALVASLRERFPGRRIHYVVAVGESKDALAILRILAQLPSTFTFTSFSASGRRAIPPARLRRWPSRSAAGAGRSAIPPRPWR